MPRKLTASCSSMILATTRSLCRERSIAARLLSRIITTWSQGSSVSPQTSNLHAPEKDQFAALSYLPHAGVALERAFPFLQRSLPFNRPGQVVQWWLRDLDSDHRSRATGERRGGTGAKRQPGRRISAAETLDSPAFSKACIQATPNPLD